MQRNKRYKTYPFPYLSEDSKDYKKTTFKLRVKYIPGQSIITLQALYELNNSELKELIDSGLIKVVAKIKCSTMGLSRTAQFKNNADAIQFKFDSMQIDGDVETTAFLIATDDFHLSNSDLSNDWINENAMVQRNNVIGESNTAVVTFTHIRKGASKSIFKFTLQNTLESGDPYRLNLEYDEYIEFRMSKQMFNQYKITQNGAKDFVYGVFIIPSLVDIFRRMIEENFDDDSMNEFNYRYSRKKWYGVLIDNYDKAFNGANPREGKIEPIIAAQTIISKLSYSVILAEGVKKAKGAR